METIWHPNGPVPALPQKVTTFDMGPKQKKAAFPPARLLALFPFFSFLFPPWRRQLRHGQKRPTKGRRKKNKTKELFHTRLLNRTSSYSHPAVRTTVQRSCQRGVGLQAVRLMGLGVKGLIRIRMPFWFRPILARSGVETCHKNLV